MHELFLQRLVKILPPQALDHFGQPALYTHFRVNTLKASIQDIHDKLKAIGVSFETVNWYAPALSVPVAYARGVLDSSLVAQGLLYPQGLESMQAVVTLDPQPGECVLDLCAAPGSKTTQIAAHTRNEGVLVANEPVRARFYRLKTVLNLTGARSTLTMVDGRRYRAHNGLFDRVLVDAPCSSEGRFKKDHPKTYAYWSLRKIKEMAHKQKGLLLSASRLMKPGGVLVYSTCTFAPEENEEVLEWFLRKVVGFTLESQVRILPDSRLEGFFIAKLRKI
ncbi:MAG: RsmB/NOP family class I SAM-dependent RNA methyltransferase [Candidatus Omnitrophica bacterium]|nr:RsmB/NOP family class I SAM-dependent RNA methyltransferase [Candidatus Omnitrophota bacterium]